MRETRLLGRAKGSGRLGDTLGETVLVDFVDELLSVGNSKLLLDRLLHLLLSNSHVVRRRCGTGTEKRGHFVLFVIVWVR